MQLSPRTARKNHRGRRRRQGSYKLVETEPTNANNNNNNRTPVAQATVRKSGRQESTRIDWSSVRWREQCLHKTCNKTKVAEYPTAKLYHQHSRSFLEYLAAVVLFFYSLFLAFKIIYSGFNFVKMYGKIFSLIR